MLPSGDLGLAALRRRRAGFLRYGSFFFGGAPGRFAATAGGLPSLRELLLRGSAWPLRGDGGRASFDSSSLWRGADGFFAEFVGVAWDVATSAVAFVCLDVD